MSETGSPVLTPELVLVSPELLAEAQQRQTKRKAAMSSSEPANGTFFVDPAQPAPPPVNPEVAPPPAPAPEPVAAPAAAAPAAAQSGSLPSAPMIDVPLGTLIFRAGLLAEEQLEDALQEGMRTGKRLGEVLIERGWLHERDLGRLLAGQKGLPFVEISPSDAEPAALQQLPEEKAKLQVALPLRHEDGQLVVAVADPSNELMLENLRRALGAEPKLVVAPYADLVRSIGQAYGSAPPEAPAPPEPAAQPPVRVSGPVEGVSGEPGGSPAADVAQPQPEIAQPEAQLQPQPEVPQLEVPQPEVQPAPQPEAQLVPPAAPEPVAEPIQPLTPPTVAPLPTVLPPAEERATEPVPSPLAPPPPAEPAPPPAAVQETPAVEAPVTPAIETVPPLHQQAAPEPQPEPVAPPAPVAPVEPEAPVAQPPLAQEPVLQPPVSPPAAAEAPPAAPAISAPPVESPAPQAPVQEEQGSVNVVVLRLRDGDALEIGSFPPAEAAMRAQEIVAEIAAAEANGTWPFFAQRYLRPNSILSVDLVEENADQWLGSAVRRSWAGQQ